MARQDDHFVLSIENAPDSTRNAEVGYRLSMKNCCSVARERHRLVCSLSVAFSISSHFLPVLSPCRCI